MKMKDLSLKDRKKSISKTKTKANRSKEKIYSIAGGILILDQFIKIVVRSHMDLLEEIKIIPNFFSLYYVENKGAAFSILGSKTLLLIVISVVCIVILDRYIAKEEKFTKLSICSLGLILGGIFGNLIDRIWYHSVTDYLSFSIAGYSFPVFNLADIAITLGVALFILAMITEEKTSKERKIGW